MGAVPDLGTLLWGGHGIPLVAVPARFTTQEGSGWGFRVQKPLSLRTPGCPSCGVVLERDDTAARNILAAALVLVAARNRTVGQAETGLSQEGRTASGQTASPAVFARARGTRAG